MTSSSLPPDRLSRAGPAIGVALLHVVLGYLLLVGLGVPLPTPLDEDLTVIALRPPEKPAPEPPTAPRPAGESSPRNLKAKATQTVAPPPVVRFDPPPVVATLVPALGAEAQSGASELPGPGNAAGGERDGVGYGGAGDGDGGGGTPARWLAGRIRPSDYPDRALDDGVEGITGVRLTISERGRVTGCTVTRSSGSRDLDDTTCRLIQKRFRYEPARDAWGRPVEGTEEGAQEWTVESRDEDG